MSFAGILFALLYAVVLTAIFSLAFKNTGPWGGFWIFFFLLFIVSLSAGEWAPPAGPVAWGYYWVPGLIAATTFALLLAAVTPASPVPRNKFNNGNIRKNTTTEKICEEEETTVITVAVIGTFFWVLMVVLIIAAIAGVIFRQDSQLV
jgi:apolipoprotein N-acyltransferase